MVLQKCLQSFLEDKSLYNLEYCDTLILYLADVHSLSMMRSLAGPVLVWPAAPAATAWQTAGERRPLTSMAEPYEEPTGKKSGLPPRDASCARYTA